MRPEHKTQKPEHEMTHKEYVKSDLHRGRMMVSASCFELIECRSALIRRYIEDGHLDDAEHFADFLEENLKIAMANLYEATDAVRRARERTHRMVNQ